MLSTEECRIISDSFLFRGYAEKQIYEILTEETIKRKSYSRGTLIFSPEKYFRALGIIIKGRIRVTKQDSLVVSELTAGDIFGAASLFNNNGSYASTLTANSASTILYIPQAQFEQLLDRNPEIRNRYIQYLSERIRFLSSKIDSLIEGSGEKKLGSFLLSNMNHENQVKLSCSMTELAARLNIGRASLYRSFAKLENELLIERHGKIINILNPECLQAII